jgi:hypothetical protein
MGTLNEVNVPKCKICGRVAQESGYCHLHNRAYWVIVEKFKVYQKATNLSWSQYLAEIQKNSLTGEWAKEVAKHLIWEEEENVRKNQKDI